MSVIYDIKLAINYAYPYPAGAHRTVLRMRPMSTAGQRLISGRIDIQPTPNFRADSTDFFGNAKCEVAFDQPLSECSFHFTGRVERSQDDSGLDLSSPLTELPRDIAELRSLAPNAPHHFLGDSPRIAFDPAIAAYSRDLVRPNASTLETVATLSHTLHADMDFDPVATHVATTPTEAFAARRGVCQDISQIMITGLRSIGVPAGYVSGFLRTEPPEGQPRLEGADAMHAWIRAWCGAEMGWVDFDPTNDMPAGEDHVTVAIGRDYGDVAPIKGSLRTSGAHLTSHSVDMAAV